MLTGILRRDELRLDLRFPIQKPATMLTMSVSRAHSGSPESYNQSDRELFMPSWFTPGPGMSFVFVLLFSVCPGHSPW